MSAAVESVDAAPLEEEEEDPVEAATRAAAAATASVWDEVEATASRAGGRAAAGLRDEEVVRVGATTVRLKVDWGVGIGGGAWNCGLALCRHLDRFAARYAELAPRPLRFLELGAGTGVAGLFAAARFPGSRVVLTDLADHLDLLEVNAYRNHDRGARAEVALLDWADATTWAPLDPPPDVVLAADCAYHERLYAPLVAVLRRACAAPETTVVLGVTRSDTGADFFAMLDAAGLAYTLAERPADSYAALFVVRRARAFDEPRDARLPPWVEPESS